ncbi:MAG: D-alanine--poly(phosphoribitol) ligase, partial [Deltaproteobacteria bacterium]|nr:D-alanine--poly(phosphoribitol) ligase [Deltaproteobacteria bacterium]
GRCDYLVGFVSGEHDGRAVRKELAAALPSYMVPREIRVLPELPMNANGKVDRNALAALVSRASAPPAASGS